MKTFDLLKTICSGFVPVENFGCYTFETSNLSELACLFGQGWTWQGHMKKGNLLYAYHKKSDDWFFEDFDLMGDCLEDPEQEVYVFFIEN